MNFKKILSQHLTQVLLAAGLVLGLGACQKKIDASNAKTFMTSSKAMQASLPKEKQAEFEKAIRAIAYTYIDPSYLKDNSPKKSFSSDLRKKLDGLTYEQVMKMGEEIRAKTKKDALKEIRPQVEKLLKEKAAAEQQAAILKAIEVKEAKFEYRKSELSDGYVLNHSYKIVNNSKLTLRQIISVDIKIMNPGSTKPWYERDRFFGRINFTIDESEGKEYKDGLKPGQEITITKEGVTSSRFGPDNQPAKNAILQVTLLEVEDATGKKYAVFEPEKQKQLDDFLKNYPELAK
ncbi:MAG TPA: hypothetical protein DCS93_27420 [Microscillaceae bacterium]|nr:hypothetical protein [Microscillaceae bacterium]